MDTGSPHSFPRWHVSRVRSNSCVTLIRVLQERKLLNDLTVEEKEAPISTHTWLCTSEIIGHQMNWQDSCVEAIPKLFKHTESQFPPLNNNFHQEKNPRLLCYTFPPGNNASRLMKIQVPYVCLGNNKNGPSRAEYVSNPNTPLFYILLFSEL